jgi:hypothetical protein
MEVLEMFNFTEYVPTENETRMLSTDPKITLSARGQISFNRKALADMGITEKAFIKLYNDGKAAIGFSVVPEAGNGIIEINVKPSKGVMFSAKKFLSTIGLEVKETKSYQLQKQDKLFYIDLKKPTAKK